MTKIKNDETASMVNKLTDNMMSFIENNKNAESDLIDIILNFGCNIISSTIVSCPYDREYIFTLKNKIHEQIEELIIEKSNIK